MILAEGAKTLQLLYSYECLCLLSFAIRLGERGIMKRIGWYGRGSRPQFFSFVLGIVVAGIAGVMLSCSKPAPQPKPAPARPSDIKVEVRDGGPVVLTTSTAEFQILPSGFLQASLLKDGKRLTLDEPEVGSAGGSDYIVHDGQDLEFVPDFASA